VNQNQFSVYLFCAVSCDSSTAGHIGHFELMLNKYANLPESGYFEDEWESEDGLNWPRSHIVGLSHGNHFASLTSLVTIMTACFLSS
jgi:hypothetical protein